MNQLDPNLLAMLYSRLQQRVGMNGAPMLPQFQQSAGGMDPNLGAMLMASGQLPRHQNMQGQYILPGSQQGSALDNQSFSGLDANRAMQRNPSSMDRYSNATFSMGPARVAERPVAPVTQAEMAVNNAEMQKFRGQLVAGAPQQPRPAQNKPSMPSIPPYGTTTDWAQGVSQAPSWMQPQSYVTTGSPVGKSEMPVASPPVPSGGWQSILERSAPAAWQGPPMPEPYQPQSIFQRLGYGYYKKPVRIYPQFGAGAELNKHVW